MTKLAVREDFDYDDVECTENVDDNDKQHGPTVSTEMEISDTVNGNLFLCSLQITLLSNNVTHIITLIFAFTPRGPVLIDLFLRPK